MIDPHEKVIDPLGDVEQLVAKSEALITFMDRGPLEFNSAKQEVVELAEIVDAMRPVVDRLRGRL